MINFENIKIGFKAYLEKLQEKDGEKYNTESFSDISIFAYADEFKDYVEEELHILQELEELDMDIEDIMALGFSNNSFALPEATGEQTENGTVENEAVAEDATTPEDGTTVANEENNQNLANIFYTDFINDLLENEEVQNIVDVDGNSQIDEEEIKAFLEAIGKQDGDNESISLEDLFSTITNIGNNTFSISEPEAVVETVETTQTENVQQSSNNSANYNTGSGVRTSTQPKNPYAGMSVDELNSELNKKQGELSEVYSGSAPKLTELKEKENEAYKNYLDAVKNIDEKLAEELDSCKTAVEDQEKLIDEKTLEITNQESVLADAETAYKNAVSTKETLEGCLSSLQNARSNATDEEKAEIDAKISSVREQIEKAEDAVEAAKIAEEEARTKLETLKEEKLELEEKLTSLQEALIAKEEEIAKAHPEIAELQKTYNDIKAEYSNTKDEMATTLKAEIQNIVKQRDITKTEEAKKADKQLRRDNTLSAFSLYNEEKGKSIADAAESLYGNNPYSGGMCGAGVSDALAKALGERMRGNGCQWGDILEDNDNFVEVTEEITIDDFDDLPPGAVISWSTYEPGHTKSNGRYGHVCIVRENGGEISDFASNKISTSYYDWGATFRVFIPV